MINKNDVMKLILEACPSYNVRWIEHSKFNYSNGEEQLLYLDAGDFACHIVELYKKGEIKEFKNIFNVIELLHIQGDDYVKEAATIGFLEAIQNVASNNDLNPEDFIKFLKPVSVDWWNKLDDFWLGKTDYVGCPNKK